MLPTVLFTMSYVNDNNLDLLLPAPNSALVIGARWHMQAAVLQVDGKMSLSDLYAVRFH